MDYVVVWAGAYLLAGLYFVAQDLREPRWNRPGYVRTSGGRWRVRLIWPIASARILLFMSHHGNKEVARHHNGKHLREQLLPTIAVFLGAGVIGSLLFSN